MTKTIDLVVASFVAAHLTALVSLDIGGYAFNYSTDRDFIQKLVNDFFWTLIPTQVNVVLKSAISLSRNKPIKHFMGFHLIFFYKIYVAKVPTKKTVNNK